MRSLLTVIKGAMKVTNHTLGIEYSGGGRI
jgi:hypothetical protein